MANNINRNLDGPPTQGRRRECLRRQRQQFRVLEKQMKPELQARANAEMERLLNALCDLPPEHVDALQALDDAQCGYVEEEIRKADLRADIAAMPDGPEKDVLVSLHNLDEQDYARAVLKAFSPEHGLYAEKAAQNCYGDSGNGPAGLYAANASFCIGLRVSGRAIEAIVATGCYAWFGTNKITYKYNMP